MMCVLSAASLLRHFWGEYTGPIDIGNPGEFTVIGRPYRDIEGAYQPESGNKNGGEHTRRSMSVKIQHCQGQRTASLGAKHQVVLAGWPSPHGGRHNEAEAGLGVSMKI